MTGTDIKNSGRRQAALGTQTGDAVHPGPYDAGASGCHDPRQKDIGPIAERLAITVKPFELAGRRQWIGKQSTTTWTAHELEARFDEGRLLRRATAGRTGPRLRLGMIEYRLGIGLAETEIFGKYLLGPDVVFFHGALGPQVSTNQPSPIDASVVKACPPVSARLIAPEVF